MVDNPDDTKCGSWGLDRTRERGQFLALSVLANVGRAQIEAIAAQMDLPSDSQNTEILEVEV
jgi:hypothetical protein